MPDGFQECGTEDTDVRCFPKSISCSVHQSFAIRVRICVLIESLLTLNGVIMPTAILRFAYAVAGISTLIILLLPFQNAYAQPSSEDDQIARGFAYLDEGDWKAAASAFEAVLKQSRDSVPAFLRFLAWMPH